MEKMKLDIKPFFIWRHLNKLRWVILTGVFLMLVFLPFAHVYQTFVASFSYDLLDPGEKRLYDLMEMLTSPLVSNPATDLDAIKGTTWSANFFGYKISDPLSVVSQVAAGLSFYGPFILTALIPVFLSVLFGRFFCGWICPATFLYELNSTLSLWLQHSGIKVGRRRLNRQLKYWVLGTGIAISAISGSVLMSMIYPPAIIGREIYFAVALGGFGAGLVFFVLTLLFDLLVSRRGFCRYICPGGALYSLLGHFRVFRIKRIVENCNDCAKCNAVCEFGLDPLRDDFGQECNNCTACIAVCPTDALTFSVKLHDDSNQGPGHLGKVYKKSHVSD
ncbi:Polyferredoxin NapH (periplasmic nitrate reductase) [hydrothermal vent metagenome]|uniref:Polyferredoxin NapH (Periplasmic nitrate reductase) n=1 Tax=hydrothermal vent metagenome TaxID=652676 RepID=A0A3B0X6M5_9ZZZZ